MVSRLMRFPGAVARDPAVDAWFDSRRTNAFTAHVNVGLVDTASLEALIAAAYLDIKTRLGVGRRGS